MTLLGGMQLIGMGIIAEYAYRAYTEGGQAALRGGPSCRLRSRIHPPPDLAASFRRSETPRASDGSRRRCWRARLPAGARGNRMSRPRVDTSFLASPPSPETTDGVDPRLVAKALVIRRTEERLLELFTEGRLFGTVHTCTARSGRVAVAEALSPGDYVFSNHRCHGHYSRSPTTSRALSRRCWGAPRESAGAGRKPTPLSRSVFPPAASRRASCRRAGLAMAHQFDGSTGIAAVFVGDGTLGEGVVLRDVQHRSLSGACRC